MENKVLNKQLILLLNISNYWEGFSCIEIGLPVTYSGCQFCLLEPHKTTVLSSPLSVISIL